jgi:pyruvate,water dikinase
MAAPAVIAWFADIGLHDRARVGGKGGSLGELQRAAIEVPPGFVVTTAAFEQFMRALEERAPLRSRVEALRGVDLGAATKVCAELRAQVEAAPLPPEVLEQISRAHAQLCGANATLPLAVRSSATTEDATDASFAGLQDTFLWITDLANVLECIRSCWASLYSVESVTYRCSRQIPEAGVAMAVVVQRMVDARAAGVMFTRSPLTGDRSVVTIEGAWGLGSAVVGGEVTPDRWVLGKITGDISVRDISDKHVRHVPNAGAGTKTEPVPEDQRRQPCLSDDQLQQLRSIGRKVEGHYGRPQDIEWAIDRITGAMLLLQSRPETVWSAREAAPVAKVAQDPRMHVMSIFGGKP